MMYLIKQWIRFHGVVLN